MLQEAPAPPLTATARSLQVAESNQNIRASPITVTASTPKNFRIIQEIQIRSTGAPRTSARPATRRPPGSGRPRVPKQSSPALRFADNALVAVLGRQVQGGPVEGFPDGLPALTPLGVRITLENMIGDYLSKFECTIVLQAQTERW